jgi:plastocyanin domain-containing protein
MLSSLFTITQQGCRSTGTSHVIKVATSQMQQVKQSYSVRHGSRYMSATAKVWIDKNTRVICQGFTGKQVRRTCFVYFVIDQFMQIYAKIIDRFIL